MNFNLDNFIPQNSEDWLGTALLPGIYNSADVIGSGLKSSSNQSGSYFSPSYVSGIGPYEMPGVPELQPYKGIVWSPVPAGYRDVEHTISQMVNDPNSKYSQTLQGDPNWELFNRYVEAPMQQQLTTKTLPQINSQFGATPYGGSIYSGAAAEKGAQAIQDNANKLGELRLSYDQQSTQNMLNAAGQLPNFAGVFANDQQMVAGNQQRSMNKHFQNEQLKQLQFQDAMQQLGVQVKVDSLNMQNDQFNSTLDMQTQLYDFQMEQIKQAQDAALLSTLGTIGGGAIGFAVGGPAGMMIGSQIGGQVGGMVGGGSAQPGAAMNTMNSLAFMNAMSASKTPTSSGTTSIYEDPLKMNEDTASFYDAGLLGSPTTVPDYYIPGSFSLAPSNF